MCFFSKASDGCLKGGFFQIAFSIETFGTALGFLEFENKEKILQCCFAHCGIF